MSFVPKSGVTIVLPDSTSLTAVFNCAISDNVANSLVAALMTEIGCNPEKIGSYTKVENGDAVEYTFVYSVLTPFLDPYQQQQYQQQQQEHQQYREKQQEEHYQYQEKQEEQYQYPEKQKEQQSCNVM